VRTFLTKRGFATVPLCFVRMQPVVAAAAAPLPLSANEATATRSKRRRIGANPTAGYWPRDSGSTPAKVRKSVIRNVPLFDGNVGRQRGCLAR
jgi:hypothetical protein